MHVQPLESRRLLAGISPDPTFAGGGEVTIDVDHLTEVPMDAVVLPDGKRLIGGWAYVRVEQGPNDEDGRDGRAMLIRLNADGTRDATFGRNGVLLPKRLLEIYDLVVLADGRFLAACMAERKFPRATSPAWTSASPASSPTVRSTRPSATAASPPPTTPTSKAPASP